MKVAFLSQWGYNPCQKLLLQSLERLDPLLELAEIPKICLRDLTGARKPDIFHLDLLHHSYESCFLPKSVLRMIWLWVRLLYLKGIGVKLIWTVNEVTRRTGLSYWLDRVGEYVFLRLVDAVTVHTRATKEVLKVRNRLGDYHPLTVIPHGHYISYYENLIPSVSARAELGITPGVFAYLVFGYVSSYKGIAELAEDFSKIASEHAILLVAGISTDRDLLRRIEQARVRDPRIRLFPGAVPAGRVQYYMNAADAVLFPCGYERTLMSGVLMLAISFGRACIAPKASYFVEILGEGGAFFYEPGSQRDLLAAMRRALWDPEACARMGERNRRRADLFDWHQSAAKMLELFNQLCDRPPVRSLCREEETVRLAVKEENTSCEDELC